MKRDIIPVCSVHARFQTEHGRWLNKSEDYQNHIVYTHSQGASILESTCDLCESDPDQLQFNFNE